MEKIKQLAVGLNHRYPNGNEPYQIVTRLAEECGEVASAVNHHEGSGIKSEKHGTPRKQDIADELKNVLAVTMQLMLYYDVEKELSDSIDATLAKLREQGHL